MKRLLAIGAVVALLTACGAGDAVVRTQARASVKSIAAAREQIALRRARRLLRQIPLPPGAVRVVHAPANQYLRDQWVGGSVITMFAGRHSIWRVPGSMTSVVRFARSHPGLTWSRTAAVSSEASGRKCRSTVASTGPFSAWPVSSPSTSAA